MMHDIGVLLTDSIPVRALCSNENGTEESVEFPGAP